MILAESLSYKIDQRLNKLSSSVHQQIPLEDKFLIAQEAEIALIKKKLNPNNALRVGFEGNKKRYQDLEFLVEPHERHKISLQEKDKKLNRWIAEVPDDPKYMFYVDAYVLADKGECKNRVIWINPDLVATSNVVTLLNNSNYKPSFEYQETFCDLASDEIGIYTDGTFSPKFLYLSYIRYPIPVDLEGYEKFDGTNSVTQNSELPQYLEDELLDIIELKLSSYLEDPSSTKKAIEKIQTNE